MTSERPDFRLNSLFQVGRIMSGLRSQVIVSSESVAHSRAFFSQGLNADCLDRLNSACYHRAVTQPHFSACTNSRTFMLALPSAVFYRDIAIVT